MVIDFSELHTLKDEKQLLLRQLETFELLKEIRELRRKLADAEQAEKEFEQMWECDMTLTNKESIDHIEWTASLVNTHVHGDIQHSLACLRTIIICMLDEMTEEQLTNLAARIGDSK